MADLLNNPWEVAEEDFPWTGSTREKLQFLLHYAVLAPSGHNTQPWLFRIAGDAIELYVDRSRTLETIDPQGRELIMSCGTTLYHLRTAIRHYGYEPIVQTFPDLDDPDLIAFIRLGPPKAATLEDHRRFMAIKRRRTNRMPFAPVPVPNAELKTLQDVAREEGATLHVIQKPVDKKALADLIAEGDRIQGANKEFRRELADWLHPNLSKVRDGIPGYAKGVGDLLSLADPLYVRTFDWGQEQAEQNRLLSENSPALLVLSTEADNAVEWLAAGQALDGLLLMAADYGLYVSFLNQPIEIPDLRARLVDLIGGRGFPQIVMRMGYGEAPRVTPRRPIGDMLSVNRFL